jgi:hypothetical protein
MRLLVVSQREDLKNVAAFHFRPLGFEVAFEADPVRVIDNLEQLDPEMVLFNAVDFPRHWKPILKLVRQGKPREDCVFIVLMSHPPFEEAAKASYLGVSGIIEAELPEDEQIHQIEELYRRYRSMKDKRRFHRLVPTALDALRLIISHPRSMAIISGTIREISIQGASFKPADPSVAADLKRDDLLPLCSLRVGEELISLQARVTRNNGEMGLQFRSFEMGGHHKLFQYLQSHRERALRSALASPEPPAG